MSLPPQSLYRNLYTIAESSPVIPLIVAAISFSMYIVGFVIDNKCVKNKGYEKTYRAMKWVLALGLTSLITMFLTILIASTGKGKININPRLSLAAGIVTFICTIVGSGYGIWASIKCEDKLKQTRLGFHITAIVFALGGVMLANKESIKTYGKKAYTYAGNRAAAAQRYASDQATAARGAIRTRADQYRGQQLEGTPINGRV